MAVMDWGKTKGMEKFVSGHFVDNPASGRVLEKLGFVPVGIVDHIGAARGGPSPAQRYVLGASPQDALRTASH
ncbi:MAG: GNAT family protein [Porticoccaceae bacterium]|nr:GNAT family protein [Porticoccaceae bacterium]